MTDYLGPPQPLVGVATLIGAHVKRGKTCPFGSTAQDFKQQLLCLAVTEPRSVEADVLHLEMEMELADETQ